MKEEKNKRLFIFFSQCNFEVLIEERSIAVNTRSSSLETVESKPNKVRALLCTINHQRGK